MTSQFALIGFGEAAQAFIGAPGWTGRIVAYDKLTDDPATQLPKLQDYENLCVEGAASLTKAIEGAETIFSLVTADQALVVARAAINLKSHALYCDMNSVAPATKQAAASAVEEHGGRYVDVAIMAPVNPGHLSVPLLVSGPFAGEAQVRLKSAGFSHVRVVGERVGDASAVKMIRSVIVKGMEALTAEAMLAAAAAGVTDEVLASLEASERKIIWRDRADSHLERMMVHGLRRAQEMSEAVRMLETLGVEPALTRATVRRQREIGLMGLHPAAGLDAKLGQLVSGKVQAA